MTFRGLCGSGAVREYFGKTDEVDSKYLVFFYYTLWKSNFSVGKAFDEEDLAEKGDVGGEFAYTPVAGGPFSALLPSLWPQSILQDLTEVSFGKYDDDRIMWNTSRQIRKNLLNIIKVASLNSFGRVPHETVSWCVVPVPLLSVLSILHGK